MTRKNKFQYGVATGRGTLPVAIVLFVLIRSLLFSPSADWSWLAMVTVCASLFSGIISTFGLIRVRSNLAVALFFVLMAFIPASNWQNFSFWMLPLSLGLLTSLYRSYEHPDASVPVFNAFCCLGGYCLVTPLAGVIIPFLYLLMIPFRCMTLRTFFAGILGLLAVAWFAGIGLFIGGTERMVEAGLTLPIFFDFGTINLYSQVWMVEIYVVLISMAGMIDLAVNSYRDKVQTRLYLRLVWMLQLILILLVIVQPGVMQAVLPVQILLGSILFAHVYALQFNIITRITFMLLLVLLLALGGFMLWIHGHN